MKIYISAKKFRRREFYVGISSNLEKRSDYHNGGFLKSTTNKRPFILAFCREHDNYGELGKHENGLKSTIEGCRLNEFLLATSC